MGRPVVERDLRRIYELVGETTTLWSQAEELWYLTFTALMSESPREKVDAIYGMFQSSKMQRELIMAIAKPALDSQPEVYRKDAKARARKNLLTRIGQLHAQTNTLSSRRNAVAHTAFEIGNHIVPPTIVAVGPYKRSPLADKEIIPELESLVDDAALLVLDLADLRGDFIELDGGSEDLPGPAMLRLGCPPLRVQRRVERERILQAAAQRKQLPPGSSPA